VRNSGPEVRNLGFGSEKLEPEVGNMGTGIEKQRNQWNGMKKKEHRTRTL
jgi:hypothetical protein